MFDSITSAEYTSQMWKPHGKPSRLMTFLWVLISVEWSVGLFKKSIAHPSTELTVALLVLVFLGIPMAGYTLLRLSSNTRLKERWFVNAPSARWFDVLTQISCVAWFVLFLGTMIGSQNQQWDKWEEIVFPFFCIVLAFGSSNSDWNAAKEVREENVADTRRRWAFAYKLGRRTGSLFSTPVQNTPSI